MIQERVGNNAGRSILELYRASQFEDSVDDHPHELVSTLSLW